jgi:A/G-specific adenine glycosylase
MNIPPEKIKKFQSKILSWYKKNKRDLPWRKTENPYHILVSEIMLQQTQVDRVIPYYERFLKELPDWKALGRANKEQLLKLWSGLGYNNRVLRLQKTAQEIVEKYNGLFPMDAEKLLSLPGIGPYTANAVLAFAFNKNVAVVDTNIRRVFIIELGLPEEVSGKDMDTVALQVVPKGQSCIWYNALMDYGALQKTARATGIESLSKQSTFEGSTREVRGKIIKTLLKKRKLTFSSLKKTCNHAQFDAILEKMQREGIIAMEKEEVYLAH